MKYTIQEIPLFITIFIACDKIIYEISIDSLNICKQKYQRDD